MINLITVTKPGISQNDLAKLIRSHLKEDCINVRLCQKGDTIGAIALGLMSKEVPIWSSGIFVLYFGRSERIQKQFEANPNGHLSEANLVFPGQYLFLTPNQKILFVCDHEEIAKEAYPLGPMAAYAGS